MRSTLEPLLARRGGRACFGAAVLVTILLVPAHCADLGLDRFYEPNRCGPIALYCVCKSLKIDTTIGELADLAGFDGRETSMAGLVAAAEKKGLKSEALESSMGHLMSLEGPAIIDYPEGHFCAFFGWDGTSAIILDPPKKAELIGFWELRRRWGRHVLTFSVSDAEKRQDEPPPADRS